MLEHTDNDSLKANEKTVSEDTSTNAPESSKDDAIITDNKSIVSELKNETLEKNPLKESNQEESASEENDSDGEGIEEKNTDEKALFEQFVAMEPKELLDFFSTTLKSESVQHLKSTIEPLVKVFNQKLAEEEKKQKEAFISEGENPDAFYFNPPIKKEFDTLFRRYKSDRSTYYRSLEEKQRKNLTHRLALIEELKGLLNVNQDINATYNQFKDLQKRWKEAGQVPRMEANNIWKTYHHHVGHFYDFLHLNRELRELDFKFNLEQKLKICEQAEALVSMEDISKAFRHLQTLHKKWKDELGPVDKEHSEEVWERFSNATKIIHDKRKYFLKNQEEIFEANLLKKKAILSQIGDLLRQDISEKTNIHKFSNTYDGLREAFFAVGSVPTKMRDDLWAEFKKAARTFSKKRNQFYKQLKKVYAENVAKRKELIAKAEQLKTQTNFKETTPQIIALQKEWKTIGPVSRKDHTKLWGVFREICNDYFAQLDAARNKNSAEEKENLAKKRAIIDALKNGLEEKTLKEIDTLVEKWNSIGYVPRNKIKITQEFTKLTEKAYVSAGLSKAEITTKSYQNRLESIRDNQGDIRRELQLLNRRIDETKQEIIQLETNLQFFGKNQDKNPIVTKVQKDISGHKERLLELKEKKRLVKQLQKD